MGSLLQCPQCRRQWFWDGKPVKPEDWLSPAAYAVLVAINRKKEKERGVSIEGCYFPKPTVAGRAACPRCHWTPKYQKSANNTDNCLVYRQRVKKGMSSAG